MFAWYSYQKLYFANVTKPKTEKTIPPQKFVVVSRKMMIYVLLSSFRCSCHFTFCMRVSVILEDSSTRIWDKSDYFTNGWRKAFLWVCARLVWNSLFSPSHTLNTDLLCVVKNCELFAWHKLNIKQSQCCCCHCSHSARRSLHILFFPTLHRAKKNIITKRNNE